MDTLEKTLELLDQQCEEYRAMQEVGLAQKDCIARQDIDGLNAAFGRMQGHIDHIQLVQKEMPAFDSAHQVPTQVQEKKQQLRSLILQLQELNRINERGVRRLMKETQEELHKFGRGRRAARGYQQIQNQNARFFDGKK